MQFTTSSWGFLVWIEDSAETENEVKVIWKTLGFIVFKDQML